MRAHHPIHANLIEQTSKTKKENLRLQRLLTLNSSPNTSNLLNHIPNLHLALSNLNLQLLAILEPYRQLGLLRRRPRQLSDLDVDVAGAGGRRGRGIAEEREDESAGAGGAKERVESCAEGGDC